MFNLMEFDNVFKIPTGFLEHRHQIDDITEESQRILRSQGIPSKHSEESKESQQKNLKPPPPSLPHPKN